MPTFMIFATILFFQFLAVLTALEWAENREIAPAQKR